MTSFLEAFLPFLTCSADLREILARIAVVCREDDFFLILTISAVLTLSLDATKVESDEGTANEGAGDAESQV